MQQPLRSRQELRDQKLAAARRKEQEEDRILAEMTASHPAAIEILRRIFFDVPSYTQGDAYHTSYREGQRAAIQFLITAETRVREDNYETPENALEERSG